MSRTCDKDWQQHMNEKNNRIDIKELETTVKETKSAFENNSKRTEE